MFEILLPVYKLPITCTSRLSVAGLPVGTMQLAYWNIYSPCSSGKIAPVPFEREWNGLCT